MNTNTATEYRNLPLAVLTESATNPRRIFEDLALKELAESIRSQGVLSPLLVRPLGSLSLRVCTGACFPGSYTAAILSSSQDSRVYRMFRE